MHGSLRSGHEPRQLSTDSGSDSGNQPFPAHTFVSPSRKVQRPSYHAVGWTLLRFSFGKDKVCRRVPWGLDTNGCIHLPFGA